MANRSKTSRALKEVGVLYQQIALLIRKQIDNGQLIAGEQLPSIETLVKSYGVSPVTIRQALACLEKEGLIKRKQGRGTFVSPAMKERRWLKLESNWDALIKMAGRAKPRRPLVVLDSVGLPILETEDGIPAPSYRYMRRVHLADETPYAVIDIYVDRRLYVLDPKRFETEMVIVVLDSLPQVKIRDAHQRLTITTADIEVAQLLEIPVGSAVGIVRRVVRDRNNTVIYLGEGIYRGDLVRLERELHKTSHGR